MADNQETHKAKNNERNANSCADTAPDDYDPFIEDSIMVPGSAYPYNPYFEDGWVSDEEGHPDLTRISPCTFARLATGCVSTTQTEPSKAVIPSRSSSLGCLESKQSQNVRGVLSPTPLSPTLALALALICRLDNPNKHPTHRHPFWKRRLGRRPASLPGLMRHLPSRRSGR